MLVYTFLLLFCFISFLYCYNRKCLKLYGIFVFFSALILCGGYMCGSDWRAYEIIYNSYNKNDFWWRFLYMEPAYLLLNVLGNALNLSFWPFYIIIKLLIFIKFLKMIKKYSPDRILFLSILVFLGFWGIMVFIDPPFRNLIAIYIFLFSVKFLLNRDFKKYLLIILLACSFHYSSVFLLPLYFIINKRFSITSIVLLFIIFNILLYESEWFFMLLSKLFGSFSIIASKIENYSIGDEASTAGSGKIFSLGYFIHILFFILILLNRRNIENLPYGIFLFNISVLFVFLFRIGLTVVVFARLQLFVCIFYSIVIACLIDFFVKSFRLTYAIYLFFIAIVANYIEMTSSPHFVPYTNIVFYLDEDLSYDYRSEYNLKNSPYR